MGVVGAVYAIELVAPPTFSNYRANWTTHCKTDTSQIRVMYYASFIMNPVLCLHIQSVSTRKYDTHTFARGNRMKIGFMRGH